MTLTIVKGVANKVEQGQGSLQKDSAAKSSSPAVIATASATSSLANSDATVNAVRGRQSASESEKVRDPKKADKLADDLGDEIREERDLAGLAHRGLDDVTSSARE